MIVGTGVPDGPLQNEKFVKNHVNKCIYFCKIAMQILYVFTDRTEKRRLSVRTAGPYKRTPEIAHVNNHSSYHFKKTKRRTPYEAVR